MRYGNEEKVDCRYGECEEDNVCGDGVSVEMSARDECKSE